MTAAPGAPMAAAPVETQHVAGAGDLPLSVQLAGADSECGILFLHGILQAGLSWKYQLSDPLLARWRLVSLDLRGHGFSGKPVGARHYDDTRIWAEDIRRVIAAAGLRRVVLVGWSFGGRMILNYLQHFAEDPALAGLVFLDANTRSAPGHTSPESAAALAGVRSPDMATSLRARAEFVRLCFSRPPAPDDLAEILAYNAIPTPDVLAGMIGYPMEFDAVMAAIRVPTLVLHGAEDRLCLPASARHSAACIPGSRLVWLPGIGHSPHLEDPPGCNRHLHDFAAAVLE